MFFPSSALANKVVQIGSTSSTPAALSNACSFSGVMAILASARISAAYYRLLIVD
jgi:hypothetical protein